MRRTALVVAAIGLAVGAVAQSPDWMQVTTASSPSARGNCAMVYDSARNKTVLFGGGDSGYFNFFADTWEYDGVSWAQVTTANSPPGRKYHSMTYDSARSKVVLHGGFGSVSGGINYMSDTWEYDGVNWIEVLLPISPSARGNCAVVYDSARSKTVLFGGGDSGYFNFFADTWEYDGVSWAQVTTANSPPGRKYHSMTYDSARSKVVLHGGFGSVSGGTNYVSDTWEYDGVNWIEVLLPISPSARGNCAVVYDSARSKTVLFGGGDSGYFNFFADTWEYDGVSWAQVTTANSPPGRKYHSMTYDSARSKVVLHGGFGSISGGTNYMSDTWEYDGGSPPVVVSAATIYGAGCGSPAMVFTPTSTAIIGTSMTGTISNTPTPLCVVAMGLSNTSKPGLGALPFHLGVIGMTGCELYQSAEVFGLGTQFSGVPFVVDWSYPVPSSSAALGVNIYTQAFSFAPGANPLEVIASNGIDWLIGNQ